MRTIASCRQAAGRRQRGYMLIELMVAMLIGLFLLGGVLIVEQNNSRTFRDQNSLVQLHDNARMTITTLTDVIQAAGYFPDPTSNTATSTLAAVAPFAAGQAITGTRNVNPPGDTITVRYSTASGDGILNCSGASNTSGAIQTYVNAFSIAAGQLLCTMNGTQYPLVGGLQNLSIRYGVKTDFTVDDNNVDTYLDASQMTAANWNNISSVVITLTFNNPLYVVAGQGQPQTISIQRVVNVMNKAGIKI